MNKIKIISNVVLIIFTCILVLLVLFKKDQKGFIYNVYDHDVKIKCECIKFEKEEDNQDFIGHYTGFYYQKTNTNCKE